MPSGPPDPTDTSVPFSPGVRRRLLASTLMSMALVVLVVVLLALLLGPNPVLLGVGLVLLLAGLFGPGLWLVRPRWVLRLGPEGYRVRWIRGAGVRQAAWTQVEDVVATTVLGHRCLVLRLRDGLSTTVPVDVLAGDPDALAREVSDRLDRAHSARRR